LAVGIDRKFAYEDGQRVTLEDGHDEIISTKSRIRQSR